MLEDLVGKAAPQHPLKSIKEAHNRSIVSIIKKLRQDSCYQKDIEQNSTPLLLGY